ncbi:hypothetical protein ACWC09_05925 [Streptomyces sp. NPDC001617]
MATDLLVLRDALLRAVDRSPYAAQDIANLLDLAGHLGLAAAMSQRQDRARAEAVLKPGLLGELCRAHPQVFASLEEIARLQGAPTPTGTTSTVTAGGPRSIAASGSIGVAITGDNSTYVAGDHVDFGNSDFRDRVVGVQHNHHYGAAPAPVEWRPVDDVGALEFGVRRTRQVAGLPDVPPYAPRDCDEELRAELAHSGLVLILGEPCVGTSYTAWQAVRSLAGHRMYAPDRGEDLRALLPSLKGQPGKYVVWLDALIDHLGDGGLDPRLLVRFTSLGAVLLGTMRPGAYYGRRTGTEPAELVIAAARAVKLGREWSEAELERLAALDDPRAYPAYMWSGGEGVASYFAVGHHLFDEWRRAGTQLEHPRGQLLVRAAVDLARCGVQGAVSAELLRRVQEQYRAEERESFEDALAWATTPMFGVSGLLVEGEQENTWRAYGALVAEAVGSGDLESVPDEVWWTLLDATREEGSGLDFPAVLEAARTALQPRIESGSPAVALGFARCTEGEEREQWLRLAVDAGDLSAAVELAQALRDRGDEDGALRHLERAAGAGSRSAAAALGSLLRQRAERWLRRAAEAGHGPAARELGDLLAGVGREGEAIRWYRKAAMAGHGEVGGSLGALLIRWNRPGGEDWLRCGAAWGDARGAGELAVSLGRKADRDQPEIDRLHEQAIAGGDTDSIRNRAICREREGRLDEALHWYREALRAGVTDTEQDIAEVLEKQGKTAEAGEWLRKAAEVNPPDLLERLPAPPVTAPAPDTVKE